jgi:hypothetical protein
LEGLATVVIGLGLHTVLFPHPLDEGGKVFPVECIPKAVELALEYLEIIGVVSLLLEVYVECVLPTVELLVPVFLLVNEDVLLGVFQDALRSLWLL